MKAIETSYRGCRFRSRLEARWAVFFDHIGLQWEFEPEGFEFKDGSRYLPDFKVQLGNGNQIWWEVKGRPPTNDEMKKAKLLAENSGCFVFIASGTMDVPIYKNGIVLGAQIREFIPSDAVKVNKGIEFFGIQEFISSLMCGFYEDGEGSVHLDNLYVDDLPIVKDCASRLVFKISHCGRLVPSFNCGPGRLYRSRRLAKAYAAARSARFEFGDSPDAKKS